MSGKIFGVACVAVLALLSMVSPAMAQAGGSSFGTAFGTGFGAGIGAGITIVGAGWGFGRIGAAALESMARQPEVAGPVAQNMLIIAALLEGATFFSLIVCIIMAFKA